MMEGNRKRLGEDRAFSVIKRKSGMGKPDRKG
jgi:hypothetical protein